MSTFAIDNSDPAAVVDAVNYLLSNMGTGGSSGNTDTGNSLTANTTTGQITSGGIIISYLYPWMQVRYATAADGSTGFSTSPTNATYYGLYNSISQAPADITNPTNYQWQQVTGGFGTTKFLWYATYGGGAVEWQVATTKPSASFAQVQNGVAIDLNFVTATSTLPLVTPFIYIQANATPATPTGGTYDFGNLTLTPPSGWTANLPASVANLTTYSSQNQFQAVPAGGSVGPSQAWTAPLAFVKIGNTGTNAISIYNYTVYQSANTQPAVPTGGYYDFGNVAGTPPTGWFNIPPAGNSRPVWATTAQASSSNAQANISIGNTWANTFQYTSQAGVPGSRGFIPMGYVLTPDDPITATPANLTAWFSASRDNASAPIGMGTPPIDLDTACFTQQGNTGANVVYSFDGGNNLWTSVQGSVVNGNVFVTGSVNAAAMNANDVYALTMRGGTVTPGINSGAGFWLQANTGNAYIGGNLYIGNSTSIGSNLIIGNSATIGANLTVGSNLIIGNNTTIGANLTVGANATIGGNLTVGNNAYIGGNLIIDGLAQGVPTTTGNVTTVVTTLNVNTVNTTTIVPAAVSSQSWATSSTSFNQANPASVPSTTNFLVPITNGYNDTNCVLTFTTTVANTTVGISGTTYLINRWNYSSRTSSSYLTQISAINYAQLIRADASNNYKVVSYNVMNYAGTLDTYYDTELYTPFINSNSKDTITTPGTYTYFYRYGQSILPTFVGGDGATSIQLTAGLQTISVQELKR